MSRAEILLLAALAFAAGVLASGGHGEQAVIEEATTRTLHPAAIVEVPGEAPVAIPDPNALYSPCPLTPRNLPAIRKNLV